MECLIADKPWDVVSVTRRSSGVAPRACVRVYARVLVPPNLYIHAYTYLIMRCNGNISNNNSNTSKGNNDEARGYHIHIGI